MMRSTFIALCAAAAVTTAAASTCSDGIECIAVPANGLTFQCRVAGPPDGVPVMMLHGFPEWSSMYAGLMRELAKQGFRSVACNQRGYSPGARPEGIENYHYSMLRDDIFAVAEAMNFSHAKFHLVGHDHGAALGWYTVTSEQGKSSILSYSALSVPHLDAFSAGLLGPNADHAQQVASQYFTVFVLKDSASLNFDALYNTMGRFNKDSDAGAKFSSAADFQKALWWYNGAGAQRQGDDRPAGAGVMALPPVMTAAQLLADGDLAMAAFRKAYGGAADEGLPTTRSVGKVPSGIPTLFVCGSSDSALLCNKPYSLATKNYVDAGSYTYLEVDCGHDLLSCSKSAETDKVIAGIVANVVAASSGAAALALGATRGNAILETNW